MKKRNQHSTGRRHAALLPMTLGQVVVGGSVGLLLLLLLTLVNPSIESSSFALCTPDSSTSDCTAMPISTEVGVTTNTVISLAIANQVNLELTPKSTGATATASTKLAVSTNSNDGYALYLQAGREDGSLTGVTSNLSSAITNTEKTGALLGDLELNSYGYALSQTAVDNNTTYSRVPTTSTAIKTTHQVGETTGEYSYGDTYYLAFGTKIGTNLPAGQYAGTVTVSAVANPTTLRSMYDLTYMQDMTSDICENTKEHYTKQLIDTRDGKSYWVAKLKDGNCWMTQNLALDITEAGLKASDTDISEDWNQNSTYPPSNMNRVFFDGNTVTPPSSSANTDYWSFGAIVSGVPLGGECNGENTLTMNDDIMELCARVGYIDVSNQEKWLPTFTAQNGQYVNPTGYEFNDVLIAVNCTEKDNQGFCIAGSYDPHYLIGNYYQYNAATAGTGAQIASAENTVTNADGSICPKNWKLPTSGWNNFNTTESLGYLLRQYGFATGDNTGSPIVDSGNTRAYITNSPLYMTRTGTIQLDYKYLRRLGLDVVLTTASAATTNSTRFILASTDTNTPTSLRPMSTTGKYNGLPVRCLAR